MLDGDGLTLKRIAIDGRDLAPADFLATPDQLTILKPPAARRFQLLIETELAPARNEALMGLYRSSNVYCTQCEAEGFRRITYFLDRPDILSVYTVRIEALRHEAPLLLSNGNPADSGELADGWHYAIWHDPFPKPSYLFALVAGDLGQVADSFVTLSGRKVELGIYVEPGKEKLAGYAMDALKRSMQWDEEAFGREYDLDVFNIVAVSDFNMGAMENKGLNIFNDKYVLADQETATDADFANIEAIIAHEYFHNWTGNRITCRDWFQLCLKEGLTVFRDHEFSADQRSRAVKRIAEVRTLRAHQFPEDQGPLAHPVRPRRYREINNFYTATVYEKGSEVVRMIRTILGAETFRAGMDLYFERHDGEAATIEDFLKVFEDVSGRDLSQFSLWYHQAGTPNLTVSSTHNPAAQEFTLEIEQSVPPTPSESRKRLMHIPLAFGLVGAGGKPVAYSGVEGASVEDGVIHIRKRRHMVRFSGRCRAPGGVAQPRLFGAGDAFGRAEGRRPVLPGRPRQRRLLALAGVQHAVDRCADCRLPPDPRRQAAGFRRAADRACRQDRRRRDAGAGLSGAGAGASRRGRHRPRHRQEHRPRRHLRGPRGAGDRDRRRPTGRYFPTSTIALPTRPVQSGCGERRATGAAQHPAGLSLAAAGRRRACRPAFPVRDQHDRPRRGAHRACAPPSRFARGDQGAGRLRGEICDPIRWSWTNGSRSRPACPVRKPSRRCAR